jgi:hypothetical protein
MDSENSTQKILQNFNNSAKILESTSLNDFTDKYILSLKPTIVETCFKIALSKDMIQHIIKLRKYIAMTEIEIFNKAVYMFSYDTIKHFYNRDIKEIQFQRDSIICQTKDRHIMIKCLKYLINSGVKINLPFPQSDIEALMRLDDIDIFDHIQMNYPEFWDRSDNNKYHAYTLDINAPYYIFDYFSLSCFNGNLNIFLHIIKNGYNLDHLSSKYSQDYNNIAHCLKVWLKYRYINNVSVTEHMIRIINYLINNKNKINPNLEMSSILYNTL